MEIYEKELAGERCSPLREILKGMEKAVVLFSGGVDSSLLARAAHDTLGENATALTVVSPLMSAAERADVEKLVKQTGIKHEVLEMNELDDEKFAANPTVKCYICKKMRLEKIAYWAEKNGFPWILDGSNVDDLSDYRPGMEALRECENARSPFLEAGMTKADIRALSKELGLFTWDKPSSACLASRVSGEITKEKLEQIERAEEILRAALPKNTQFRVRHHGDIARIELDPTLIAHVSQKSALIKSLGFRYVVIDLEGYKMGGA